MTFSVEELLQIRELPETLRTEHCYNDLQHAMLVVMFRHALSALSQNHTKSAQRIIDNISIYLYIHFLNEEEGMAYKTSVGLLERDQLMEHSEHHIHFLDHWQNAIFLPYKRGEAAREDTLEGVRGFYNTIIKHIDGEDMVDYGAGTIAIEATRKELARLAQAGMPMSPFMAGAYQAVEVLDETVAHALDHTRLSPAALAPMGDLDLIPDVGRILEGRVGSLRDRFAEHAGGHKSSANTSTQIYALS